MLKSIKNILLLTCVLVACSAQAAWVNSGIFEANDLYLNSTKILNDGSFIGGHSVNIDCTELAGKGLIKSPSINIATEVFNYTGTIECLDYCEINAKQPFNEKMFIRKGKGQFKITIG